MLDSGYLEDLLERMEREALVIDRTGDVTHVHHLFRSVHNFKSSLAQVGLHALSSQAHNLEDALEQVRRGRDSWRADHYAQVMRLVDLGRRLASGGEEDAVGGPPEPLPPSPWGLPLSPEARARAEDLLAEGQTLYRLDKLFQRGLSREAFQSIPVWDDLAELGTLVAFAPDWESFDQGPQEQVVQFLFATRLSEAELGQVLWDPLIRVAVPVGAARTEPLRILIVEDDPTVGCLLQFVLQQQGDARLCPTGGEGITAVKEAWSCDRPYDLVVLDVFLPDVMGGEVLKAIRAEEDRHGARHGARRAVVLLNTASQDLEPYRQSQDQEPDGYLFKPLDVEALLTKVRMLKDERLCR